MLKLKAIHNPQRKNQIEINRTSHNYTIKK